MAYRLSPQMGITNQPSRSSTPPVVRLQKSKSSIVNFTRPGSGSRTSGEDPGGFKLGSLEEAPNSSSRPQPIPFSKAGRQYSRSLDMQSLSDSAASFSSLPPLRRPDGSVSSARTCVQGFNAPDQSQRQHQQHRSPSSQSSRKGLLSRQLREDASAASPPAWDASRANLLKEKLEKCLGKSPSSPPPPLIPALKPLSKDVRAKLNSPLVQRAYTVACVAHQGQQQNSLAVLAHCIQTAHILAELGLDQQTIAAGLLHHVLEGSMMTEAALQSSFPAEVVNMVVRVARISEACSWQDPAVNDSEYTSKLTGMLLGMADVRCTLVKLASSLHLLRTLGSYPPEQQRQVANATLRVLTPLANRLGVWGVKAEMEDLCFKALHPAEHAELHAKLAHSQQPSHLQASLDAIKTALEASKVSHLELSGRPKNLYGIFRKMQTKGYGVDQIYDVRALRIIVDSKVDCYHALRAVHKLYPPLRAQKDYIKQPKGNGYQSLHTVVQGPDGVPIEVQIRTAKMHMLAEFGMAAHWRYKEQLADAKDLEVTFTDQQVAWARYVITWQMELADKKCRPSGSPPHDKPLAAFASQVTACSFPEHDPTCKFAAYMQKRGGLAPLASSEADQADRPVHVILFNHVTSDDGSMTIESVPPRCTAGQLAQMLRKGELAAVGAIPAKARVLVNQEEVHDVDVALAHGDKVEIFQSEFATTLPATPALDAGKLERERERLARIYNRSAQLSVRSVSGVVSDIAADLARVASDKLGLDVEQLGTEFVKVDPLRRQGSGFVCGQPVAS